MFVGSKSGISDQFSSASFGFLGHISENSSGIARDFIGTSIAIMKAKGILP